MHCRAVSVPLPRVQDRSLEGLQETSESAAYSPSWKIIKFYRKGVYILALQVDTARVYSGTGNQDHGHHLLHHPPRPVLQLRPVVGGILVWIVLGSVILKSFRTFHRPQRVLVRETGGVKEYEWKSYEWKKDREGDSPAKVGSAWAHGIAFGVLSVVMISIVL